jgi:hypothetical protein
MTWLQLPQTSPANVKSGDRQAIGHGGNARTIYGCMALVLVATTLFARFGINFGSYSLDFALVALYILLAALLYSGRSAIDESMALLYVAAMGVAALSLVVNDGLSSINRSSPSSLLLLAAIYLPFVFTLPAQGPPWSKPDRILGAFSSIALICALAGIAQFYLQFVINQPWLFDFTPWIPETLRGPSGYNTVIEVGDLYKSNGFFLREPSGFSFVVALAMIIELTSTRRWWRMATFGLALLLTYSGTGVLALIVGLLFPISRKSILRLVVLGAFAFLLLVMLGDALNLSVTANRVTEVESDRSSAYIRYIAPMRVVLGSINTNPWAALLGHGPGSIQRTTQGFEFFDPTWAKLLFEYGLTGYAIFVSMVLYALHRSPIQFELKAVLFGSWLVMGGHLLSPENVATLYVLAAVWRPAMDRKQRRQGEMS